MGIIEIVSVILIIFSIFRGIKKNLTTNILSFLKYLSSILIAMTLTQNISQLLQKSTILNNNQYNLASFLLVFIISYSFFSLLIIIQKMIVDIRFLPPLEKPFGVIIGVLNGILSIFLLSYILSFFHSDNLDATMKKSLIYEKMIDISVKTDLIIHENIPL